MKLSISNIAWSANEDKQMYEYLSAKGFSGLEIAPTRIFQSNPYSNLPAAKTFSNHLKTTYTLVVSSMQSIWYGKNEKIFGSPFERRILTDYTRMAIDFAAVIGCHNLVMGCPKNRIISDMQQYAVAVDFFQELGDYACWNGTVLSIEANPVIYGTNFINRTDQAFELARTVNSQGFKVNLDLGTMVYNNEDFTSIYDNISLVNHVHISEPELACIKRRPIHQDLASILQQTGYSKFISVEMKDLHDIATLKTVIEYIKEVFS